MLVLQSGSTRGYRSTKLFHKAFVENRFQRDIFPTWKRSILLPPCLSRKYAQVHVSFSPRNLFQTQIVRNSVKSSIFSLTTCILNTISDVTMHSSRKITKLLQHVMRDLQYQKDVLITFYLISGQEY